MPGPHGAPNGGYAKPKNAKKTVNKMLEYIGKSKYLLVLVSFTVIASTVCSVLASARLQPIIDKAIYPHFDKAELIKQLVILAVFYITASVLSFAQSKIMVNIAYKTSNTIRKDLFNHLQSLPLRYFDSKTHGEIMSRFTNDVDNMQMMLEQSIVQLVSSIFTIIGIVVMMIYFNWRLFLIMIVFLALMIFVASTIGKKTRKYFQLQQKNLGEMNGFIEETVEGMKVVKVFNHEEEANEDFRELNENFRKSATKANFYSGIMGPCSAGINNTAYAVITIIGALLVIANPVAFTIGKLTSFLTYTRQFSQPINQITNQMNTIFSALAGAERVFEVMEMEPEVDDGTVTLKEEFENGERKWCWNDNGVLTPVEGNVVFDNVTFGYVPEKTVLKNVSLYAKPGQKIAFVGSTGAGKTTITNLINRFYDIQDGVITYDGIDIKRIKKDDLRKSLSIVLQDTHLFTGTVMDNIRYGRLEATDEECIAAAKLASAHSFIRRLPNGYNTVISGDGDNLSQGQRQLLAIARAAVAKPAVLILDEATSSVDTRTELHIEHGMDRLMIGRTVFVIAHRLSTVRNSDAIMVLEHGEILERGNHEVLLELKGRYYELCTGKAKLA
ncbi:MAG: ABC transporter ATP-binding protein/permease [Eubacterium sp.]|nr:ABC transporter ATP-binding protein/permease [Eubacterium sp.]